MKKYDIIIIGAGIAGSTFGYLMKKKNKKVLIIEKNKISSKDKLCGGLLTKKSYDLLVSLFDKSIYKLNILKHNKCTINDNRNKFSIDIEMYSIYRKDLDDYVLNQYLNVGGELLDEVNYQNLNIQDNMIEINNEIYQYDFLIGADGVFSSLRKKITGRMQKPNFALELLEKNSLKKLEIHFLNTFKGYGWIIPNKRGNIVGIGNVVGERKIEDTFNSYLEKLKEEKKNIRDAFLPSGNDIYLNYNNIFFIGDAAGLISPITGEGIYYALLSSKILSENLNKKYVEKMKKVKTRIRREKFYLKYVYHPKIRNYLFSRYDNIVIRKCIQKFANKIL